MKLIEAFPRWFEGGVFSRIGEMDTRFSEWATVVTDFEYFAGRSGNKTISPLLENALKALNVEVADEQIIDVAAVMLISKYGSNWVKLWEVANAEYNPIENYSMVEEETPNITRTETPNITKTETPNITRTETPNVTVQTEAKQATDVVVTSNGSNASDVFGFNSAEPVPQAETNANASQHTQGDAENNTQNATRTETGTRQHTETGTRQNTESGTRTETETGSRKLTRSGNIGVTTSQQMIESEIALRRWVFLESVFADVDSMLTCPMYEL